MPTGTLNATEPWHFCIAQIETEGEMQLAADARRGQVMLPERDVTVSRPKRPVSAADVKLITARPRSAGYGREADKTSTQSNKENVPRPTKFRVCEYRLLSF